MIKIAVFLFFLVVQILDVISTFLALERGAKEANFVVRFFMDKLGFLWWIPKMTLALCGGWILISVGVWGIWFVILATIIYVWVVFNNFRLARR